MLISNGKTGVEAFLTVSFLTVGDGKFLTIIYKYIQTIFELKPQTIITLYVYFKEKIKRAK